MLPPPCFIVGMVFRWWAAPAVLQKWGLDLGPNSSGLVLSDSRILFLRLCGTLSCLMQDLWSSVSYQVVGLISDKDDCSAWPKDQFLESWLVQSHGVHWAQDPSEQQECFCLTSVPDKSWVCVLKNNLTSRCCCRCVLKDRVIIEEKTTLNSESLNRKQWSRSEYILKSEIFNVKS